MPSPKTSSRQLELKSNRHPRTTRSTFITLRVSANGAVRLQGLPEVAESGGGGIG
jgi:hypothetical protein